MTELDRPRPVRPGSDQAFLDGSRATRRR